MNIGAILRQAMAWNKHAWQVLSLNCSNTIEVKHNQMHHTFCSLHMTRLLQSVWTLEGGQACPMHAELQTLWWQSWGIWLTKKSLQSMYGAAGTFATKADVPASRSGPVTLVLAWSRMQYKPRQCFHGRTSHHWQEQSEQSSPICLSTLTGIEA